MSKRIICYCDGSCRPQPGITGYGVHMYFIDDSNKKKPKQILGLWVPTADRYTTKDILKDDKLKDDAVAITDVFDIYGYNNLSTTNNQAELDAAINIFKAMVNPLLSETFLDVTSINVLFDSTYVIQTIEAISKDRSFTREVNETHIAELSKMYYKVIDSGITITVGKVLAHSGDLGNDRADLLSNMGRLRHMMKDDNIKYLKTSSDNYWGNLVNRPPLFTNRLLFDYGVTSKIGDHYYYHSLYYKEDSDIGRSLNTVIYTEYASTSKNDLIEMTRDRLSKSLGSLNVLYTMYLDAIYNKSINKCLELYGDDYLLATNDKYHIVSTVDDLKLANEIYPAGVSYQAHDRIEVNINRLSNFISNKLPKNVKVLSIKDLLLTKDKKGNTIIMPEIVNDNYNLKINLREPFDIKHKLTLRLRLDLPKRNNIKRIEKDIDDIFLIVEHSGKLLKYYTIVVLNEGDDKGYYLTVNQYAHSIFLKK